MQTPFAGADNSSADGGNIRVGFLYRTDRDMTFTPRGTPTATTAVSVSGPSGSPQLSTNPGRILAPTNEAALKDAFKDSRKRRSSAASLGRSCNAIRMRWWPSSATSTTSTAQMH